MPISLSLSEKLREAGRRKKRSPISKKRKGLFMKTGSAYEKNVCGGGSRGADALSGARTSRRHAHRASPIFN
jgi:hypothetical protein